MNTSDIGFYTDPHSDSEITVIGSANQDALAKAAAAAFVERVVALQQQQQFVRVVLTGGGAGIATLKAIAALDVAAKQQADSFPIARIDWSRVLAFFGDERFVEADNPERNDLQAREALLDHVAVLPQHVFAIAAPAAGESFSGVGLDDAAADYARVLEEWAPDGFDIHLLGMGPEGHINSLFPHRPELLQPASLVVAVRDCPKPPANRVSLSIDAVNMADEVWLLVAGEAKREAAAAVVHGGNGAQWPAALAVGKSRTVLWVDEEADPR